MQPGNTAAQDFDAAIRVLYGKGVRIWVENGCLRYRAPKGAMSEADVAILRKLDSNRLALFARQRDGSLLQPRLVGEARPNRAPLTFNQLAHWQLRKTAGHRPIREVVSVTRISGALHTTALNEVLSMVTERHNALRTHIVSQDGEITQELSEQSDCSLCMVDITDILPSELDGEIHRQIASAIFDVFDYRFDPLTKLVLLRLQKSENILVLAMDHMVSDGVSNGILEQEIFTTYEQLIEGRKICLPVVQMQYPEYASWQRTSLGDYFEVLGSGPPAWGRTRFPADASAEGSSGWAQARVTLSMTDRLALAGLARRMGTTLVMCVLTAYVALVMRWCDVFDTVIQVMSDGRTSPIIQHTVGYLAYPQYLHISVDRNATFTDLFHTVTEEFCRECENPSFSYFNTLTPQPGFTQNTRFNWIPVSRGVEYNKHKRSGRHNTITPVIFNNPALKNLDVDSEPAVVFQDVGTEIAGFVAFPRSRFSLSTMLRFARAIDIFISAIVASPTARIRQVAMTR